MATTEQPPGVAGDKQRRIEALAPWFHNLHLPGGVQTLPNHFLGGDFPAFKWREIEPWLPKDLGGWRVLDVGCNAGFYSFQLAERGATVLGIDVEPHYLTQAEWARSELGLEQRVEFAAWRSTTSHARARRSTSSGSWASSITCAIRCSRSTCSLQGHGAC